MHWLRHSSERLLAFPSHFLHPFPSLGVITDASKRTRWFPHPEPHPRAIESSLKETRGPLVIRKQGVCIRMEAFVYIHSRARDSKLLSYGFSSLGGERTSLASLFQASSTGHASGSGNQNLVGFSFLYTKFQKSPSCGVSSGTRRKKSLRLNARN